MNYLMAKHVLKDTEGDLRDIQHQNQKAVKTQNAINDKLKKRET